MVDCQIFNIRCAKFQNLNVSLLVLQLSAQSIEAMYYVEDQDVVGAVPIGYAQTTSEWSMILLPTKVWLKLDNWTVKSLI